MKKHNGCSNNCIVAFFDYKWITYPIVVYWKQYWAQRFTEYGYQVKMEVPRISAGRTDILACKNSQKIAVEIETGKSNYLSNLRQNLQAKYDKIVIIVTSKSAFEKIEKSIIDAGLLIAGRVNIALREDKDCV